MGCIGNVLIGVEQQFRDLPVRTVFADTLILHHFLTGQWLGEIFGTVKFSLKWKIAHKLFSKIVQEILWEKDTPKKNATNVCSQIKNIRKTHFSAILLNFGNYITTFL